MHSGDELPLVAADMAMSEAIVIMTAKSFGCLGIVGQDGALQGILTDGDLRRHMGSQLMTQTTGDVMTAGVRFISANALASEALRTMNSKAITTLFVVEDSRPIGIVHIHDCLRAGVA